MEKKFIYNFEPYEVIVKTMYEYPQKMENGKRSDAVLHIITKDMKTGVKKHKKYKDPKMIVYVAKEEHAPDNTESFYPIDKLYPIVVSYDNVTKELADELGEKYTQYWFDCIKEGRYSEINNIHKSKRAFRSDMDIEDYVRYENYFQLADDVEFNQTLGFYDIEVDSKDKPGFPEPEDADRPVNAVTYIDGASNTVMTLLLRNSENPQIAELEADTSGFVKFFKEFLDDKVGRETMEKYNLDFEYKIKFFDEEIDLLATYFKIVQKLEPDFIMAWNARFDTPYMYNRIKNLGYNPNSIVNDSRLDSDYHKYYVDDFHFAHDKKSDVFKEANQHNIVCQLITYASSQYNKKPSYKLGDVANDEVGFSKVDLYKYTDSHANFPYDNYKMFVAYNIIDVIAQVGIERKTGQVGNMLRRSIKNATRPAKLFRQTIKLKNRATIEYEKQGLIIGNNQNVSYSSAGYGNTSSSSDLTFSGGVVADPTKNGNIGVVLFGRRSKYIHNDVIDYDYSSLYPSIIEAFNNSDNTQYGRILFDDDVIMDVLKETDLYTPGEKFVDDIETRDVIHIGRRWFNMPPLMDVIERVDAA